MNWVTIQKLSDMSGYTVAALRNKIQRGEFVEGIHYRHAPDGRVHFNVEAYEAWVQGIDLVLKRAA